eukprot:3937144-Rhodomonas_salina.3
MSVQVPPDTGAWTFRPRKRPTRRHRTQKTGDNRDERDKRERAPKTKQDNRDEQKRARAHPVQRPCIIAPGTLHDLVIAGLQPLQDPINLKLFRGLFLFHLWRGHNHRGRRSERARGTGLELALLRLRFPRRARMRLVLRRFLPSPILLRQPLPPRCCALPLRRHRSSSSSNQLLRRGIHRAGRCEPAASALQIAHPKSVLCKPRKRLAVPLGFRLARLARCFTRQRALVCSSFLRQQLDAPDLARDRIEHSRGQAAFVWRVDQQHVPAQQQPLQHLSQRAPRVSISSSLFDKGEKELRDAVSGLWIAT